MVDYQKNPDGTYSPEDEHARSYLVGLRQGIERGYDRGYDYGYSDGYKAGVKYGRTISSRNDDYVAVCLAIVIACIISLTALAIADPHMFGLK